MNNEDFDEAIRKKLEGLNQTYTESDIDKVYRHVKGKRRFPFKGSTGSWLLYSLSAAAFTVVTIWTVSHFQEKGQFTIQNKKTTKQVSSTISDTISSNNFLQDTVSFKNTEGNAPEAQQAEEVIIPFTHSKTENQVTVQETATAKPVKAEPIKAQVVTSQAGKETVINLGRDKDETPAVTGVPANGVAVKNEFISPDSAAIIDRKAPISPAHPKIAQPITTK